MPACGPLGRIINMTKFLIIFSIFLSSCRSDSDKVSEAIDKLPDITLPVTFIDQTDLASQFAKTLHQQDNSLISDTLEILGKYSTDNSSISVLTTSSKKKDGVFILAFDKSGHILNSVRADDPLPPRKGFIKKCYSKFVIKEKFILRHDSSLCSAIYNGDSFNLIIYNFDSIPTNRKLKK